MFHSFLSANQASDASPNSIVFWAFSILVLLSTVASFFTPWFQSLWQNIRGHEDSKGMRRMFVFNPQPYLLVLYISVALILAGCLGGLILFAVGGIGYGLLWLVFLLLWAVIIIGWLGVLGGIITLFAEARVGILAIIVGAVIIYFQSDIASGASSCKAAGAAFYDSLNLWSYFGFLIDNYAILYVAIASIPLMIGLNVAVLSLICAAVLSFVEAIMTKLYNIKHPCPFCHNPSEPADYYSERYKLPIKLRPSMYGLLHVTHPKTGEKMPTMILNGRDQLNRKCPHCHNDFNYQTGIEKHMAFVGLPESGKTCLTYRFIAHLMTQHPGIEFTDDVSHEARTIITDLIQGKEQELASKTAVNDMRRSLQLLVPNKAKLPYHLFINDVGGELFTTAGHNSSHVQFFKNVQSISVLIDPFTMDFSEYELGAAFSSWYQQNVLEADMAMGSGQLTNVIHTAKTMIDQYSVKAKKVRFNLILVKTDTGYLSPQAAAQESKIRDFIISELGLEAEVMDLENTYASLHFYAVSALHHQGFEQLTTGLLNDLNIHLA